jgi:hypothetical protein
VVECGGLENRFGGDSSDEGSNPSPSVFLASPVDALRINGGGAHGLRRDRRFIPDVE